MVEPYKVIHVSMRDKNMSDFEDPGLFIPLLFEKRALMFDLGDIHKLSHGDILKVTHDLHKILLRVLSATFGWHVCHRALYDF